jgi:uncharacterized membrane protein
VKTIGIILIVLGALALVFQGITYTKRRQSVSLGPATITAEQKETIPLPPILGGVALLAGIALVVVGSRRRS